MSNDTKPEYFPELFFGIVGPTGCDHKMVIDILKSELGKASYEIIVIKLSNYLKIFNEDLKKELTKYDHIKKHMDAGTSLRKQTDRGDILALLAITKIVKERVDRKANQNGVAYILDSLKHPSEIKTFRSVYGDAFSVVSVYTPRHSRITGLAKNLANSEGKSDAKQYEDKSIELINRDEDEKDKLGQRVKDAFPLADLFVDTRTREGLKGSIKRYIESIFKYPYHTPTKDEFCMAIASHASLRSADLSRQVGAAIATKDGEIIALGCNEVQKYGGGMYWPGDTDSRDYQRGYDSGTTIKNETLHEVLNRFRDVFIERANDKDVEISEEIRNHFNSLLKKEEENKLAEAMRGTLIRNLLEFGRSVHAEMAALMDAALRGVTVKDATLYSTTFPCHLCARHIVAAGITRVVYIEPYPKSLAGELYSDSLLIDPLHPTPGRVTFEPFVGISPWRYTKFFEMIKRKDDATGEIVDWRKNGLSQRFGSDFSMDNGGLPAYCVIELTVLDKLMSILNNPSLKPEDGWLESVGKARDNSYAAISEAMQKNAEKNEDDK